MDIFTLVKKNVSIETIVSEYTTLKRAGSYLKARCPFHHEKTASFTISPGKEIFYCFGCHQGGDVIMFISKIEQCSQKEAALLLATRFNVAISDAKEEIADNTKKERYYFIYNTVLSWLKIQLKESHEAQKYIKNRGIEEAISAQYHIGYFPNGRKAIQSLIEFCKQSSILINELTTVHILISAEKYYYSPFEDRIIFPIQDTLGRVCGFGGRIFKEHDTRAKYYNTHETDFFQKGLLLFGLSAAKETMRTKRSVFVVEGYTDCILMAQYGYQNTVATLGTACTEHHLKQLARYVDTIYFLYDGDKAGNQALLRVTERCWKVNLEPYVIQLQPNYDPASYMLEYKTLDNLMEKTHSIFSFFISEQASATQEKTLHEKIVAINAILSMIMQLNDPIKQAILLKEAADALVIDVETLKKEFLALQRRNIPSKITPHLEEKNEKISDNQITYDNGAYILVLMLRFNVYFDEFLLGLCALSEDENIRIISKKIVEFIKNQPVKSTETLLDQLWELFDEHEQSLISRLIVESDNDIDAGTFKQISQQFERQMFKKMVKSIKVQFSGGLSKDKMAHEDMLKQLIILQKKFKREI